MQKRRSLKIAIASAFAVGALIGGGFTSASAFTAQSSYGYFSAGGNNYQNYASLNTGAGNTYAAATTGTARQGGSTPSGYVGSRGRLFMSSGSLHCEGSTTYNNAALSNAHWLAQSCAKTSAGTSYSYGVSYGWNGNGYNSTYTSRTTNLTNN